MFFFSTKKFLFNAIVIIALIPSVILGRINTCKLLCKSDYREISFATLVS